MIGGPIIRVTRGGASKAIALPDYLDAAAEEHVRQDEYEWIKQVRHARVGDASFRQRFVYRGDSLWWFAELYLHKQQAILALLRTIAAFNRAIDAEAPERIACDGRDRILASVARAVGRARRISVDAPSPPSGRARLARMDARAMGLHAVALLSRLRPRAVPTTPRASVAAFVHRAFWREGEGDGGGEGYIGPVLRALEREAEGRALHVVSVGPASNFQARRWWHPLAGRRGLAATPVEAYAPLGALRGSRRVFAARHAVRTAMWGSRDLRELARMDGLDCWPIVAEELAGVALLQFPWSARAMDEAGAALDRVSPAVAITYAEGGGWGRALVLECRRRGIPSAGLQHGFIYRHWLNYRHEPDEMMPDAGNPGDAGFPRPTATLLFDGFAAAHLEKAGRFPPEALQVTGSPRLDATAEAVRGLTAGEIEAARRAAGAGEGEALLLVVTKAKEARDSLPALIEAAGSVPGVHLAIKTHPAETPDAYTAWTAGRGHVTVLPAAAALAPLLAAARAVVTVNSTVALDAAVLGIPALVVGLPNNLSPFVEAGAVVGANPASLPHDICQILYDEEFRQRLAMARGALLERYWMRAGGDASKRTAAAVLRLAGPLTGA